MHPQIVSDHPGVCPICQMKLQRVDDPEPEAAGNRGRLLFYRHPMRPDVTSPTPAKDEMGMDYVPVYAADVERGESTVPGHAGFSLSTERQQLIGVTRGKVEMRDLALEIRAGGRVAYDPDLYQAIVEYREALRARASIAGSHLPEAQRGADAIVRGAALRLRQRGFSEAQVRAITARDADPVELLLPGKAVWVYAQVYEYEADLVRPGQPVVVTTPALPGVRYDAEVAAVDPILDAKTRSLRVRARVATPDARLRPETYVTMTLAVPLGRRLAVPRNAVLDTGEHRIAFVVSGAGHFEPRDVQVGRGTRDYYEVLGGLADGDEVVSSANFLIDSESRFRAALAAFTTRAEHRP
jgi:multidrug efflux pump subunit AcrA (membrane-fusion protein)